MTTNTETAPEQDRATDEADETELLQRIVVDLQLQIVQRELDIKALRELTGPAGSPKEDGRTVLGFVVRHHDGEFMTNPLIESLEPLVHDEAKRYTLEMFMDHDLAIAARMERGWSGESDILPVTIEVPGGVAAATPISTASATDPVARLVEMRHATCKLGSELRETKPDVANMDSYAKERWAEAIDGLGAADDGLLSLEEAIVEGDA